MKAPTDTLKKVISQLQDELKKTAYGSEDIAGLALQLLVWAKLSSGTSLKAGQRLDKSMLGDVPKAIIALQGLASEGTEQQQRAFLIRDNYDSIVSLSVLEKLLNWSCTGLLDEVPLVDAIWLAESPHFAGFPTPPQLATLMVAIARLNKQDSVYCPWDRTGQLASRAAAEGSNAFVEAPEVTASVWLQQLVAETPFHARQGSPIDNPVYVEKGRLQQFDCAISMPPFGFRMQRDVSKNDLYDRFPHKNTSGSVLVIKHLLAQVKGRIVIGIANGLLFKSGSERNLRQELVSAGFIETVISLPGGLFRNTSIPVSLLVLNKANKSDKVRFIDATADELYEKVGRGAIEIKDPSVIEGWVTSDSATNDKVVDVPISEVSANDFDLMPTRYVLADEVTRMRKFLATNETVPLDSLVQVVRPLPKKKIEQDDMLASVYEYMVGDLPDNGYLTEPDEPVEVNAELAAEGSVNHLRAGDILISTKGTTGAIGLVGKDAPAPGYGGWVAGQTMLILRITDKHRVDPKVLYMQLKSPVGQLQLQSMVQESTIPTIRLKELKNYQVILPDLKAAEKVVEAFDKEVEIQQTINALAFEKEELVASLWPL